MIGSRKIHGCLKMRADLKGNYNHIIGYKWKLNLSSWMG